MSDEGDEMSIVVISDTHFGLEPSTLTDPGKTDLLVREIRRLGDECEEIVLLGDIFDFWRSRPEKAIRDGRYLFQRLAELDLRVSYVVGNHDHHLTVMNQESRLLERAARGEAYSIYIPNLTWSQTINGLSMDMYYPVYLKRCGNLCLLLTHGHHLDGVQAFSLQVIEKLRRLSGDEISPADLEMMMAYAYESIYRSSYIGEMLEFEEQLWKVSSIFGKVRTGILRSLRFTPVERQYEAIARFIRDQRAGRVDCFVYGDTHRAGMYRRNGGPLAVNVGSLTGGDGMAGLGRREDSYLLIGEEGLAVRQLGMHEPLISHLWE